MKGQETPDTHGTMTRETNDKSMEIRQAAKGDADDKTRPGTD